MNSDKIRIFARLAIGTAICAFGSWQAAAQGVPEPVAPVKTSDVDIIVTAQRRAERLVDVPMSITAVNSTALAKAGIATFSDLDQVVVGVKIGNTGIFPEPSIRGITSFLTAGGADSNVAVYVDGFYQADPLLFAQDIVNLQGIEVLKGPQGSLYGRNASGGAILIRTLDPDMDKLTGKFSGGYGNYNDARGSGYVSIPLAPGLAMSASGSYRRNDGYIKAFIVGKGKENGAPYKATQFQTKLKWDATDNLSMTLGYHYTFLSDPNANSYNITHNKLPILVNQLQTDERDHVVRNVPTIFRSRSDTVQFKLVWKSDIGTLTAQSQWQRTSSDTYQDDDDTALDFTRNGARFGKKGFDNNLEFQLTSVDRLNLVMGVNYFADKSTGAGFSYAGTNAMGVPLATPTLSGSKSWMKTRAFAPYIDGTYGLTDKLFLTAGVRYTSERKTTTSFLYSGADLFGLQKFGPLVPVNFSPDGTNGGYLHRKTFRDVTPRVVLRYELSRGANVYASFSQGFKSGTFNTSVNPLNPILDPTKPEKATNYEVGFKMARPRFRVEGAVFYTKYRDLQTSTVISSGGRLSTVVINAKGAENYGAELNFAYTPVDDLNIHGGVGYTHARYLKFPNASVNLLDRRRCFPIVPTCDPDNPAPDIQNNPNYLVANQTNLTQDFTGLQIERAPDWTANFGIDYTAHIGGGALILSSNASYVSSYYPRTAAYDPETHKALHRQKGYAIVNAQATYNFAGDNFSIGAWIKNLTDKRFKTTDVDSANGSYTLYSWPRTFGFNVGYRF